jgi:hypothetical protein
MPSMGPTWEFFRKLEDTVARLDDDLGEKHMDNVTRLVKIETILEDMKDKLFGHDGQPGHEQRIAKLEALAVKIGAIAGVLIILIEVVHQIPFKELFGFGR